MKKLFESSKEAVARWKKFLLQQEEPLEHKIERISLVIEYEIVGLVHDLQERGKIPEVDGQDKKEN